MNHNARYLNEHPLDRAFKFNKRKKYMISAEQKLLNSTKSRATSEGLEHNLDLSDIIIPSFCPVFGISLTSNNDRKTGASVDRLDPLKGYTKGNVRIICMEANRLKNNGTIEQFEQIIEYMRKSMELDGLS